MPARRRAPARRPGGQLIPLAVGTATAVVRVPDSGLVVRMTQGRAWIGVLGLLLAGIVALNVVTLGLATTAGRTDRNIVTLEQENSLLRSRDAQRSGAGRIHREAATLGLSAAPVDEVGFAKADRRDAQIAAERLASAGPAY